MSNATEQFWTAIRSAGLEPPTVIVADGKPHRFPTNGKPDDDSGWYIFFTDGIPAGCFGDWRTGHSQTWRINEDTFTAEEEAAYSERIDAMRREREAEEHQRHAEARDRAAEIWDAAQSAPDDYPYLRAKHVTSYGLRLYEGQLVVPVCDAGDLMYSLQFIDPDGGKWFLRGGRVRGCYFVIGKLGGVICIVEGYATGASIHAATGCAVAVAFNAGNLEPAAQALWTKLPQTKLIICGDDDCQTDGNPGIANATKAARAVDGLLAIPQFTANEISSFSQQHGKRPSDFNDLAALRGPDAVKQAIDAAQPPDGCKDQSNEKTSSGGDAAGEIAYRRMSDIKAQPIRWLWPGVIARGKVSMIAGHPGLGKSQLALGIAATVSSGGRWPVDGACSEVGSVLLLSAEDDAADTIRPRLEATNADLLRCYTLDAVRERKPDGKDVQRGFNLKTDLARLEALLVELGDVALIVIDPITAYLGGADSHKNAEIQALLAPLGELAARYGVAVVCVTHLNKGMNTEAIMRVTGSVGFVAVARAAYIVVRDVNDGTRRLFLPLKNNISGDQAGLAFTVEALQLPSEIETSRVVWEDEPVHVNVDEAMASPDMNDERSATDDAIDWLRDILSVGSMKASAIFQQAGGAGFSEKVVRRAKKKLGIKPRKDAFEGGWSWSLPEQGHGQGAPK